MNLWRRILMENPQWGVEQLKSIWRSMQGHCTYCGVKILWKLHGRRHKQGWEVDHWIPRSRGGGDDFENLWPACWTCNRSKSDKTGGEYLQARWDGELEVLDMWVEDDEIAVWKTLG